MGRGRFKFFEPDVLPAGYTPPAAPMELAPIAFDKNLFKYEMVLPTTADDGLMTDAEFTEKFKPDTASRIVSHSDDRTADPDYHFIGVDTTAKPVTITLPLGTAVDSGKTLLVKDEGGNASTNAITVTTSDGTLIDGESSVALVSNYASIGLYYNGSGWHIY